MKKKLLLILSMMLIITASVFQSSAYLERPYTQYEDLEIKIVDHVVYMKADNNKYYTVIDWFDTDEALKTAAEIKIAEKIDGIPVRSIDVDDETVYEDFYYDEGREHNTTIKEINIPSSIKYIHSGAFSTLDAVETIIVPETVESLGEAFVGMESLKSVTINCDVDLLTGFNCCPKLEEVIIGGTVKEVCDFAFQNCANLKSITLPDTIENIGEGAFYNSGLESISMPVCDVGETAFQNCKSLNKVVFTGKEDDTYLYLREGAFSGCVNLEKLYILGVVPKKFMFDFDSFKKCNKLTDIYFYGSPEKWEEYYDSYGICGGNEVLDEATVHYYYKHTHDFEITVKNATCKKAGTKTYTCYCGDTDKVTVPKADHSYGLWKVAKKATKKADGTMKRTCFDCGKKEAKAVVYGYRPGKTSKITASVTTSTVTLSWKAVKGATGYRIYRYNYETGKYKKIKDIEGTKITQKNLVAGLPYKYAVKAYCKVGKKTYFSKNYKSLEVSTEPRTPTLKVHTNKNSTELCWDGRNDYLEDYSPVASDNYGYVIYRATNKNGKYTKIATIKRKKELIYVTKVFVGKGSGGEGRYNDRSIKNGKTYYYKVRAVVNAGGKNYYSKYSKVVSIKK